MRGAREGAPPAAFGCGIIPAHAGSTQASSAPPSCPQDHPRACGEHRARRGGSSPRMRGARRRAPAGPHVVGIIPAHAGSTSLQSPFRLPGRDHPRACGEHRDRDGQGGRPGGSSPRMRGALLRRRMRPTRRGIIPAYAESTQGAKSLVSGAWDHPRVCGEHHVPFTPVLDGRGSSPRMRGARRRMIALRARSGIIPAYAGSTSRHTRKRARYRDHPRVCGEHLALRFAERNQTGSSPRMRGAPLLHHVDRRHAGIIPAYAGSTSGSSRRSCAGWDHPRVCGEHFATSTVTALRSGSSPRMRDRTGA